MAKQIIEGNVKKKSQLVEVLTKENSLQVSEFFFDTIQGEGVSAGQTAAFLRVTGCTLDCKWCDSAEVWREGDRYSFNELCSMMILSGLVTKLQQGQHLILTGGSPLKQQESLVLFINRFTELFNFKPYIEVENECVLMPTPAFEAIVDQWNNSPKLANSGMKERARYRPMVLAHTSQLKNSWFKFVIDVEEDWQEIQQMFIDTNLIQKNQIILMPCGATQEELMRTRTPVAELAIKHGVRFSDRLHVTLWNQKTGV
jgi:7-carboxy-7-deazaguanine synthase